jgi:hypothetical protein
MVEMGPGFRREDNKGGTTGLSTQLAKKALRAR